MEYLNANFQGDTPMKPNRSNQRSNLVAGIWMPLTLMLLGVVLVAPIDFGAAPDADKDLAQQIFDTMVQLPGNKPGNRLVHAKGIVCQGTFAPSKNAAAISQAGHFNGARVPVIVRFSDNGPDPGIADISPDSAPRGMFKMNVIKAAAVQLSPVLYSREGTVDKVVEKIIELGRQGVQFATFPETVVPYYPYCSFVQRP
jgi:hypothetical protein